ncbi:MAG: hypothetical protein ACRESP_14845 [Pseudomonas sp.]
MIYMGLMKVEHIQQQLLAAGRAADIPVAVIENGTRADQRVFTGQLNQLANLVAEHQVPSPAHVPYENPASRHCGRAPPAGNRARD